VNFKNLITTIALITITVLINFLTIRYSIRIDLTENQIFTLTAQSQAIASQLNKPLKVLIFDRNIDTETQTLLQNYQRYSQNFSYQLVDPQQEISLAKKFNVQSLGEIYLESGTNQQKVESLVTPLGTNVTEVQLTNAIAKMQRDRTSHLYFLQGHGEPILNATEAGFSQAITERPFNYCDRTNSSQSISQRHFWQWTFCQR
jgi:ABC-type uncharacterized transport system involved in gliding motility auxiliary subunit